MTSRPCRRATPARPFREQIAFSRQFLEILSRRRDLLLHQIAFSGQNRRLLSRKSDLRLFVTPLMRCGPRGSLGCAPLGRPQNRSQRVDRLCWTAASAYGSLPACPARLDALDSPLMRIAPCAPRSAAGSRPGRPLPARSSGPLLRPAPRSGSVEGCDKDVLPSALSCPPAGRRLRPLGSLRGCAQLQDLHGRCVHAPAEVLVARHAVSSGAVVVENEEREQLALV